MEIDTDRRRVLELAGAGTALSLAGCSAFSGNAETPTDAAAGVTADGEATVAVAVQPDQQKLQQRQSEIRSELQAGNVTRSEAQQQMATARTELLSAAISSFQEQSSSTENLSIVDAVDQFGIVLVSGSATAVLGTLEYDAVNALLPQSTFQQAKSQAAQQQATPTPSN